MTFAWPFLLWLLTLPIALLVWELVRVRGLETVAHPKIVRAQAGLKGVSLSSQKPSVLASSRRRILFCVGLALGIAALARPQWGHLEEPVLDPSREVIIALDLSRSMLSEDVKPSRLERSKLLIESLLDHLRGERVGLIVFSGSAFLQSPPSPDYEILRDFLPSLNPDYMPEGGTNYRDLLDTALEAFGDDSAADRYLIILSDGEATDDNWKPRISALGKHDIRIIGLGVGTDKGAMIPDGSGGFMKDDSGAVVLSKLESGTLRQLAGATRGAYRDASEWVDLPALLQSTVNAGHRGSFVDRRTVRYIERYQWALAPALLCLLASFCLEFPVRPKPREIRLDGASDGGKVASAPAVAAVILLLIGFAATRNAAADAAEPDPARELSRTVARLAAQDSYTAYDWADLAHATIDWGSELHAKNEDVPARPIDDALIAVDRGSAADSKAADWPHLRSELEELRKSAKQPPPEPTPSPTPPPQQKQDKPSKSDQNPQSAQNPSDKTPPTQSPDQKNADANAQSQPQSAQPQKDDASGASAPSSPQIHLPKGGFGDMNAPTPTSSKEPPKALQSVGGAKKDQPDDPARKNPDLAVPLEKLEQVKSQDSPTRLYELLRKDEPITPTPNKGPNW